MVIDASLSDSAVQRHRQLLVRGACSACVAHVCFLALFAALGIPPLAWFNVGSVLFYVGGAWWSLHRRPDWLFPAITIEVVLHAALATHWTGWDSGFHYYLFALLPVLFVAAPASMRRNLAIGAALGVLYLALDRMFVHAPGRIALSPDLLAAVRAFNIASAFSMTGYFSWYSATAAQRSELELERLATTDPLTGLANRRHLLDRARAEIEQAGATNAPLCVLLADLDRFKAINDEHGHEVGDAVLAQTAERLRSVLPDGEPLARWGGEEFLAVLPVRSLDQAVQTAERMCAAMRARPFRAGQAPLSVTFTVGAAQLGVGEALTDCIARADAALYEGKRRGRDRVVAAPDPSPSGTAPVNALSRLPPRCEPPSLPPPRAEAA